MSTFKFFLIVILLLVLGCGKPMDFDYGIKQINAIDSRYNASIEKYPKNIEDIGQMLKDFSGLKSLQLSYGQEQLNYIIDYKILNLEAERLYIESQKFGGSGTTKNGFGCKSRPLVTESAHLRNQSALKGFEAVSLLREFVAKYPKESNSAGLSEKNALFLNATFYLVAKEAKSDSSIINRFCPKNVTLGLYQEEFRKKTNLSKELINNLTYDEAVIIWKKNHGVT